MDDGSAVGTASGALLCTLHGVESAVGAPEITKLSALTRQLPVVAQPHGIAPRFVAMHFYATCSNGTSHVQLLCSALQRCTALCSAERCRIIAVKIMR